MSNKKKKKRKKGHVPSSEPSSPFSFEFIFPLPFDSSNHFRPSLYTTFLSLSLFFPPTLLFLFPRRKYRQGYRGVLREDLVFTWPETRYPRYTRGCLPTCFTLTVKIRLSAPRPLPRDVPCLVHAGRRCIIFPLARQIGSHGFDLELRTLDIAGVKLPPSSPLRPWTMSGISKKRVPQCSIERGSV